MANINTFAENMNKATEALVDGIKLISAYGESATTTDSSVSVELIDGTVVTIPSTANLTRRMERAENTISAFTKNQGIIETDDDTYRKVKVETVPKSPSVIDSLPEVTDFHIDANWFFEDLMFPKCSVKIDLKGKIDDDSDKVYINRVILDYKNQDVIDFYDSSIVGKELSYSQLIEQLNQNNIHYSEDLQLINLPLSYEHYVGEFVIDAIKNEDSYLWYYLNTLNYKQVDENGLTVSSTYVLSVNDKLRFNDSLYVVTNIDMNAKKIRIEPYVGYESPAVGYAFNIYNNPYSEKNVDIAVGFNEIDIIYIKAVNSAFNIVANEWSVPTSFITNNLKMKNSQITLSEYYPNYVIDFGKEMITRAKQNTIYATDGIVPNTPVLDATTLEVVQINTQLEATLDTEKYNNLTSSIVSTKSTVEDLRKNLIANKETLTKTTIDSQRTTLQNQINSDTESLSTYTTQYNTLVNELNTLLNENGAIGYTPKYHIRGFFPIPEPKYTDSSLKVGKQEVIGFDIMYRYIHTDNTATDLKTFNYNNNGSTVSAVFSDWNMVTSKMKEQVYDSDLDMYKWVSEEVSDGTAININQIDIPIRNGEKVEIKVRSISEAGYPSNPLKSAWSNSVIISFPSNLISNDGASNIINSARDDKTAVTLQQTLSAAGVYTHLSDSTENFKHDADNISITVKTEGEPTSYETIKLSEYLTRLSNIISNQSVEIENLTARLNATTGDTAKLNTITEDLANFEVRMGNNENDIQDVSTRVSKLEKNK